MSALWVVTGKEGRGGIEGTLHICIAVLDWLMVNVVFTCLGSIVESLYRMSGSNGKSRIRLFSRQVHPPIALPVVNDSLSITRKAATRDE